jgi:UDPglucose--hexose-1-phosphate uridylyltransferase
MAVTEFRQDIVSGQWVLISTERSKKPDSKSRESLHQSVDQCPFEDLKVFSQGEVLLAFDSGKEVEPSPNLEKWSTVVIKNRYPALKYGVCGSPYERDIYSVMEGHGFHELVITKDHDRSLAHFNNQEIQEVLMTYRGRYRAIAKDNCADYILIFHNHGKTAGASVYHNHSQILSTPIIPPEVAESLKGADRYFKEHGRSPYEVMLDFELREGKRIVYQNESFVVLCAFASKTPYEIKIFPKYAESSFGQLADSKLSDLADAMSVIFKKLHKAFEDIDYNFYIHTAPVAKTEGISYDPYRWHIEISPRVSIAAGFEWGTSIFINHTDPDDAAKLLRETQI